MFVDIELDHSSVFEELDEEEEEELQEHRCGNCFDCLGLTWNDFL